LAKIKQAGTRGVQEYELIA
jgi:hypothetical protein